MQWVSLKKKETSSNMPHLALIYNIEALEVFKISGVISRELRRRPMGKTVLQRYLCSLESYVFSANYLQQF